MCGVTGMTPFSTAARLYSLARWMLFS
jgi:hypothetical protein